jgi:flagellar basal-body rod protein FlgG
MFNGLYAAASGMEAQQTQLDAVSNDLANIDTTGYQSEVIGFHDLLYTSPGPQNATSFDTGAGSAADLVGRDQALGQLQQTGRSLDIALVGQGYLQVQRPNGTLGLTRNGALEINANRQLTTATGMRLVPPVTIPNNVSTDKLTITSNGTVEASGRVVGRLGLVTVPAPNGLLDAGDSTYSASAASGAIRPATGVTVQQGALESSNVDMTTAMATMIDAQRSYQMDSKAISMQDQMMQIANQIAK